MVPVALGAIQAGGFAAVSSLTEPERVALATAHDGRDHQEEAFAALLANARRWTPGPGDEPVRLEPDLDSLLADPDAHRGALCRITGALQQHTRLSRPFETAEEWFIRDETGRPILVYVAALPASHGWRDGDRVEILARFYKRVDARARDGTMRSYPGFVGALPQRPGPGSSGGAGAAAWSRLWLVAAPVGLMLAAFFILVVYVRRVRERARPRPAWAAEELLDRGEPLPDDPAEALAEMRRRAEAARAGE